MFTTEELITQYIDDAATDPAYIDRLKKKLIDTGLWEKMGCPMPRRKLDVAPPAAPERNAITAIRAALFDNWPAGTFVKGTPNRFGMTLELWDRPADDIEAVKLRTMNHTFRSNMSLMDRKALRAQVKSLRKPRINTLSNVDPDYLDAIMTISEQNPGSLIGMFNTTIGTDDSEYHRGVYYHPFQFVVVEMKDGSVTSASVVTSLDGAIELAPFVKTDYAGDPLKGKVIRQSRLDLVGFDPSWDSRSK